MKKTFILVISTALLSGCFSIKSHLKQTKVTAGILADSALDNAKKLYMHRLTERIVQLNDYIDIIENNIVNQESRTYYAQKAKELFAPTSIALIKRNGEERFMPVDSFFYLLSQRTVNLHSIDSVYVPIWNRDLFKQNADSIVYSESRAVTLVAPICEYGAQGNSLPILSEQTEDGEELIPLLGDLVTQASDIKKNSFFKFPSILSSPRTEVHSITTDQLIRNLYKTRIKLVDEFFDRFNGKEGRMDIKDEDANSRIKNLLLLFNGQLFKSGQDSIFMEAQIMAETIMANDIKINYSDTTWIAKAVCQATLNGKPISLTLYLNVENRKEDMYKWVIGRAEGDALKLLPSRQSDRIMLMPDDHETNFMSLHRITTEKDDYITLYAPKGFQLDETSVFYTYVYSGQLDIDYVSNLEFIFMQVPGYVFTLKQFERETYNAGWLINSFYKISDEEKQTFLNSIY